METSSWQFNYFGENEHFLKADEIIFPVMCLLSSYSKKNNENVLDTCLHNAMFEEREQLQW